MCTVTLIPRFPGVRLACNRDEQRSRPPALPPRIHRFGERRAILPIDPLSGGTWLAVTDAGLMFTLLNVNEPGARPARAAWQSRGTIIPRLLHCGSLAAAERRALRLDPAVYEPFCLVMADDSEIAELRTARGQWECVQRSKLIAPTLFTSSGLGDCRVDAPRRRLFHERFADPDVWTQAQDAFHRHCWPERRELSVCMERADAQTVSISVAELRHNHITMTYRAHAPGPGSPPTALNLDRPSMVTSCGQN